MGVLSTVAVAPGFAHTRGTERVTRDEGRAQREMALVRAALDGDRSAFETLYEENVRRVYALSYRMTGDAQRAEELTQDVFVRAWQKLGSFRGQSAFSSWLHPLTVNVVYSEARARRRREARITTTDDLTPFDRGTGGRTGAPGVDLERALAGLPAGAREVFVLHDVYGYKHEEIGEMTGIASGTSKAQLHRARRLLREALGR
jgi:RNA polymerase sigma-70 factor (ECF subfamily)